MKHYIAAAITVAALAGSSAHAATVVNQLVNGSFEHGLTGWTSGGVSDDGYPPVVITYGNTNTYPLGAFGESIPADNLGASPADAAGSHGLYFVADEAHPQTISQMVSTIAGNTYDFGFDIYVPFNGAANPNDASFSAIVAGVPFATFTASSLAAGQWLRYTASGVAATTGPVDFDFDFSSFGYPAKDFVVDRVYFGTTPALDSTGAVPEPASWAMMLGGFGLVGGAMRSRRKAAVSFG
jgi:hypothetical protein